MQELELNKQEGKMSTKMIFQQSLILFSAISLLIGCSNDPKPENKNETIAIDQTNEEQIPSLVVDSMLTEEEQVADLNEEFSTPELNEAPVTTSTNTNRKNIVAPVKTIILDQDLSELTALLATPSTVFLTDPTQDTLITCEKGTQLFFPKDCFVFEDGTSPSDSLEIEIKECYDYTDFIGENLTTTSHGALLETGGMLNVTATSNGKTLVIKPEESYTIYFPKKDSTKEMQFFYGTHDSTNFIDWELAEDANTMAASNGQSAQNLPVAISPNASLEKICKLRIKLHTSAIDKKPVTWEFKDEPGNIDSYLETTFDPPSEMIRALCKKRTKMVEYDLHFDESGRITNMKCVSSVNKTCDSVVAAFLNTLPLMDMKTMGNNPNPNTKFSLGFGAELVYNKKAFVKDFEEKFAENPNAMMGRVESLELNTYVMSATQMGWINCDRFWNTNAPKSDFYVTVSAEHETNTFLIFKDIKSIMSGSLVEQESQQYFSKIPKNTEVKLIALRYINDQPQLCIQEVNTSDTDVKLNDFQSFSLSELKDAINSIN